ncbi:eukaryotic long-chain fatty acid CoA synthetase (LC-FACS) [Haplosporangium sp. Z 11]|nr:eukaryotic long-chain fatty acid CoA synthetase (LC-FACS) [Haplosporangium sp. Z 11]
MAREYIPGHVGCPRADCEVKLVDVPDKNYVATDIPYPRGEIQIRGSGVFKGYFKDDEKTRETIDSKGWPATGNIGFVNDRGCSTIIDHKKNIFKV